MDKLYVTFQANVRDDEWKHGAGVRSGTAEIEMQVPRHVLLSIDPGNLFLGVLEAALNEFDAQPIEKEK